MKLTLTNNGKYIYNGQFSYAKFSYTDNFSYVYVGDNIVKSNDNVNRKKFFIGSNLSGTNDGRLVRTLIDNGSIGSNNVTTNYFGINACFTTDSEPFTQESYQFNQSLGNLSVSTNTLTGERVFTLTNNTNSDITITGMALWIHFDNESNNVNESPTVITSGVYIFLAYNNFESPVTLAPNQVYVATIGW